MTGYAGIHAVQADWETPRVVASVNTRDIISDGSAGLSPNKLWYAVPEGYLVYSDTLNHLYVIDGIAVYSTVNRGEVYRLSWQNSYLERWGVRAMYWLDNEHLIYETSEHATDKPGDLYIINPFDGTTARWEGEIDLAYLGSDSRWAYGLDHIPSDQYPSPDLTRTVYKPAYNSPWGIYDVMNGELIRVLLDIEATFFTSWMPDSSHFITEVQNQSDEDSTTRDLILFDRDGFPEAIIFTVDEAQRLATRNAAWSLDSNRFAFTANRRLYIAYMDNQQVVDSCINIEYGLAWSPDATQLAFFQPGREQTQVMVLDLEIWSLYPVTVHIAEWYDYVLGWRANN